MLKKITLFLSVLFLLSACGGGSGGGKTKTIKEKAIEKITAYAEDGSRPTPSLQDYIDAGVTGVRSDNLADLNALIDKTVEINKTITLTGSGADSDGDTASDTAQIVVTAVPNQAPTANLVATTTNEDTAKAITLSATDPESSALTYSVVTQPTNGTLSIAGNTATYAPNGNYNGTDSFTYKVNDGDVDSNTATVNITITAANDGLPVAVSIDYFTQEGTDKEINLIASDVDGDALIYSVSTAPTHGTVSLNNNVATYTPIANYTGRDSFSYTVFDGTGDLYTAIVSIFIGSLNDTGITKCANQTANNLDCPISTHPNQDAQSGRDVTHNDDSDGHAGFSYTKISSTGTALTASATSWSCVKDNVTGLIWEVKTDDNSIHDKDNTYTWYNPDNSTNGGNVGTENGDNDTDSFITNTNSSGLCGSNDWRLPNRAELTSIVDRSKLSPAIDSDYFPNNMSPFFWSSSPFAFSSNNAWLVHFKFGYVHRKNKRNSYHVRLVRSGQ